jgi:hypothetical protein
MGDTDDLTVEKDDSLRGIGAEARIRSSQSALASFST